MPITATIARLRAEAARCDRLASGLSDPDLIARLSRWAADYRADAGLLAGRMPAPPTSPLNRSRCRRVEAG